MPPLPNRTAPKLDELVTVLSATETYSVRHDGNLVTVWEAERSTGLAADQVTLSVHLGTGREDSPRRELEGFFPLEMYLTVGDAKWKIRHFLHFVSLQGEYFADVDGHGATFRLSRDVGNHGPSQALSTWASVICQLDSPFEAIPEGDSCVDVRPVFFAPDNSRTLIKRESRKVWAKHLEMDMQPLQDAGKDYGTQEVRNTWLVSDPDIKPGDILENLYCYGLVMAVQPVPRSTLRQVVTSEEATILSRPTQAAILRNVI